MGAHPYWYTVNYHPDFDAALNELREREFQAGRYNPAMNFIEFPITPTSPEPSRHPGSDPGSMTTNARVHGFQLPLE